MPLRSVHCRSANRFPCSILGSCGSGVVHKELCEISGGFSYRAEGGWALDLAHLDRCQHNNPTWLSCLLGEDICKVEAVCLTDDEPPETITDVKLGEQNV